MSTPEHPAGHSILVVEDEAAIRRFVRLALGAEGHTVHEADSVARGLIEAGTRRPDLVVLDLGLPDGDGIEVIHGLRRWSTVPVIVLSARSQEADKIAALDAGADDYLVKPFGAGELMARVRAQLRRHYQQTPGGEPLIAFGDVRIDLARRTAERAGQPLHLTPIITHQQLLKTVWGPGHADDTHYVRVHMANLRKKVEDNPSMPRHLRTEAGIGYRFVP